MLAGNRRENVSPPIKYQLQVWQDRGSLLLRGIMNDAILQLFLKSKHFQISDTVFGPRSTVRASKDSLPFQVHFFQRGTLCPAC